MKRTMKPHSKEKIFFTSANRKRWCHASHAQILHEASYSADGNRRLWWSSWQKLADGMFLYFDALYTFFNFWKHSYKYSSYVIFVRTKEVFDSSFTAFKIMTTEYGRETSKLQTSPKGYEVKIYRIPKSAFQVGGASYLTGPPSPIKKNRRVQYWQKKLAPIKYV